VAVCFVTGVVNRIIMRFLSLQCLPASFMLGLGLNSWSQMQL
jgi:hypothetical protein